MLTLNDERRGLVMTTWDKIRERVRKVEPNFAAIVDKINPGKEFPLFLAYYPYGVLAGDQVSQLLPSVKGGFFRLNDPSISEEVKKHLGYGYDGSPLGLILEKNFEFFIDLPEKNISVPWLFYTPGTFFPITRFIRQIEKRVYAPNNILVMASGVRSTFMLPNIGCKQNYTRLQRSLNINLSQPNDLYQHWCLFEKIANSNIINSSWVSCILYFSESWVNSLLNDDRFNKLKQYLLEIAWQKTEYSRSAYYYDITFSMMQKKHNLKPDPYLVDTARHLFSIALGVTPGFLPITHENSLPLNDIQKVFVEIYGLSEYLPTIMAPQLYSFEDDDEPIYYSLQYPTIHRFSPKSRATASILYDLRELKYILDIFIKELSSKDSIHSNTILNEMAKNIRVDYYHNKPDKYKLVSLSNQIAMHDKRFYSGTKGATGLSQEQTVSEGKFARGCISIKKKQEKEIS